jgi:hypothetical protein
VKTVIFKTNLEDKYLEELISGLMDDSEVSVTRDKKIPGKFYIQRAHFSEVYTLEIKDGKIITPNFYRPLENLLANNDIEYEVINANTRNLDEVDTPKFQYVNRFKESSSQRKKEMELASDRNIFNKYGFQMINTGELFLDSPEYQKRFSLN